MNNIIAPKIDTLGFIFTNASVKTKIRLSKKHIIRDSTNIFNKDPKYCAIILKKKDFLSSTLNVCTNNEDMWTLFIKNLYKLLRGFFLISFTKHNIINTIYTQFIKYKYNCKCEELKMFFRYNISPSPETINDVNIFYKLHNECIHTVRFYYDDTYNPFALIPMPPPGTITPFGYS
jgi:hypothetical protein